tara:strand:- start:770 stop:1327 length:558 start_codon:yes stop_codon:yes gene_type:complete
MKKSELRQIIKEELKGVLKEEDILIWHLLEEPFENLLDTLEKTMKRAADPKWKKALNSVHSMVSKAEYKLNVYDRNLGAIKTNESVNEASSRMHSKDMNAFAQDVEKTTEFSDAWDDVSRSGVRYIAFEMEGMNKKAEGALKANVKKLASKYGFAYVPNYATAKKLGLEDAYADDAVTVYVGKAK